MSGVRSQESGARRQKAAVALLLCVSASLRLVAQDLFVDFSDVAAGTADIYITEGPSANIYNNTWRYSQKDRIVYLNNTGAPSNPQLVNIFNNSFIITYSPAVNMDGPGYNNSTINVKNNIFYDTQTGSGNNFCVYFNTTNLMLGLRFDYNHYYGFNTGGKYWGGTFGELNVTQMRAIGYETNGASGDPLYVALSSASAPLAADLALQITSPCRDVGTNLSTYFTTDKNSITRPQGSAWDIGAYEYQAGGGSTTYRGFSFGSGVKLIGAGSVRQ